MLRKVRKFLTAGIRDTDSIDFRKLQFLANYISFVLISSFSAMILVNTFVLCFLAYNNISYLNELVFYGLYSLGVISVFILYIVRIKTGKIKLILGAYYSMLIILTAQSLLMGEYANVHLGIFVASVVPVFFRELISFMEFLFHAMVAFLLIFALYLWFHFHPQGFLPRHTSYNVLTTLLVTSLSFFVNLLLAYYMWKQNQRGKEELMEQKRIVQGQHELLMKKDEYLQMELDFAFRVQQSILPPSDFSWNTLRVQSFFRPVAKVSGDYYEIREEGDFLFVMIADVSGHGVPAALVTMLCKQVFSSAISARKTPSEIVKECSLTLWDLIHKTAFITVFLLKIDKNYKAEFCSAGHNYPLYFPNSGKYHQKLNSPGAAIGLFEPQHLKYSDREIHLSRGDRIFLYTDGIPEQKNDVGKEFGVERMLAVLEDKDQPVESLFKAIDSYKGHQLAEDDMTLVKIEII